MSGRIARWLAVVLLVGAIVFGTVATATAAEASPTRDGGRIALDRVTDELPVPEQDPATSDQQADDILGRPEFDRPSPGIFQRVSTWVSDHVSQWLHSLLSGGTGSALSWAVLGTAVGLVGLLVWRLTRTVQHEPWRPDAPVQVEVHRAPDDWRREAEACEARGEWKDALRCRYRALVADLVARRVVRDLPGRTTGEQRRDVARTQPDAAADFAGAAELFERAWYGDRPTGPDENARFRELADRVVARAGRPARHHRDDGVEGQYAVIGADEAAP